MMLMKKIQIIALISLTMAFSLAGNSASVAVDLSGDWLINSSVGGGTPIKVYCTLVHEGDLLTGACTPEMDNAEASELRGSVAGTTAEWAYDVVFNGNPGKVEFRANDLSSSGIKGVLSLSGTEAPFSAVRE